MGSTPHRISGYPMPGSRCPRREAGIGRPASAVIRLGVAHLLSQHTQLGGVETQAHLECPVHNR